MTCEPNCTCPDYQYEGLTIRDRADVEEVEQNLDMLATSKHAEQTVMPFLTEHIPMQYNIGVPGPEQEPHDDAKHEERTNTK